MKILQIGRRLVGSGHAKGQLRILEQGFLDFLLRHVAEPDVNVLKSFVKAVNGLDGNLSLNLRAINRRGKRFTCRVQVTAMASGDESRGVILMMEAVGAESR